MTKSLLATIATLLLLTNTLAQDATTMQGDIEEVTVESSFFNQKITSSTSPIGVVTAKDLDNIPLQGIADALRIEPAVSIKSDGGWATAPVIRGLSGQRVIVAVDGNRIETATEIAGGMNMINLNDIQKIEVIKSGASSMYGSGAIGGVINFITQPIVYSSTPTFNSSLSTAYQSVNNLFDEYIQFSSSQERLYFSLSGSYRNAGNTMTPQGELDNSQFEDFSINSKLGFRINEQQEIRVNYQNFQARDVGVPGGEAFEKPSPTLPISTVIYPEHSRSMTDLQYLYTDISESFKQLKLKAYQQHIYRGVRNNTNLPEYKGKPIMVTPKADHQLYGGLAQTDFEWNKQKVTAGIDIWQRSLESSREKFISQPDSTIMVRGELPLPKASYLSNGVFASTARQFMDNKLNTTLGLRYDYIVVNNDDVYDPLYLIKDGVEIDIQDQRLTIKKGTKKMSSWSANLGANYQATESINIALSGGHSFRAPNIEELYKYINFTSLVKIGNPDLVPEQSNFVDLGLHYNTSKLSLSATGFINKIDDMIADKAGVAYYDHYDSDGNVIKQDTVPALILTNIDQALLYGFEANASWECLPELTLSANVGYTVGENISDDGYLPQIAPINGICDIRYNGLKHLNAEANYEWAGTQDKLAQGENKTDGYGIINLNLSSKEYQISALKIQALAGVRNLGDTEYTNHLASNRGGVTVEPGRNFYFKLRLKM